MGLTEQIIEEAISNYGASPYLSDDDRWILEYSDRFAVNPDSLDDEFHSQLRARFSDELLVELGLQLILNLGFHTFFATLEFFPFFDPDGNPVTQEESAAIYGACPVPLTDLGRR